MLKQILGTAILVTALAATITPASAQRFRSRNVSVQGANGHGYERYRTAQRQPGSVAVNRGIQTNGGRGAQTSRTASWGDGAYTGAKTTTTNNGTTFGRTTSAAANGDGSANFTTIFTGPKGNSSTVSGTVSHH